MDESAVKQEVTVRTNFDSEFCGSIPLNFINLIQPHGVLMVLEKKSFKIVQVSENTKDILNIPFEEILESNLEKYIPKDQLEEIKNKVEGIGTHDQVPFNINFKSGAKNELLSTSIHNKENYVLLEIEKEKPIEGNITFTQIHQQVKYIMVKLKEADSIEGLSGIAVSELKTLSGFDRVMIYKFDEDWNGTVIAEASEEDFVSYLHLRFPASDIPKQARELYYKNPFRLIPDIFAKPSRLFPVVNPVTRSFTDLSDCNLRSVPAVHIEYLKNMNVTASMSTPIIKDNRLWGLISCHHKSPKYPSYAMMAAFELLSGIISSQVMGKETQSLLEAKSRSLKINTKILENIYKEDDFSKSLLQTSPNILDLLNLDGAAYVYQREVEAAGKTPDKNAIVNIAGWAVRRNIDKVFWTNNLSGIYPEGKEISDTASGLIIIPLDINKGNFIFGFRQEMVYSVNWGGNPYNAINFERDGKTYHPRNSFSLWKEIVKESSLAWNKDEIEAAEFLRTNILQKIIHLQSNK